MDVRPWAWTLTAFAALAAGCSTREASAPVPAPAPGPAPVPAPAPVQAHAPTAVEEAPRKPERVVIISIDGLRPDMMTAERMPRHVQLMREGTTAPDASTIIESDTLPSHAAMLSGAGLKAHGLWWNSYQANRGYIKVPTIFSAATEHGLSTAMIVGKQKLKHIASPGTVGHFERPSYLCGGVARRAAQYFVDKAPDLLFVHFSDPDEYGHSHGWTSKEYQRAAQNSDRCLATVLAAIDGSAHRDTTLVIVTADHGGEDRHHSNGRHRLNRMIPWIARGPGVTPGATLDTPVVTVDTAATALAALGLPKMPTMTGTPRLNFGH
jgi:predicted AlkP superfamily pyrophosphatase or phosphodiesterase